MSLIARSTTDCSALQNKQRTLLLRTQGTLRIETQTSNFENNGFYITGYSNKINISNIRTEIQTELT